MTIEVQYKTDTAYSFHAFNLRELKSEITQSKRGISLSASDTVLFLETIMSQKTIAGRLGVTPRYLRYIKTGKRLSGTLSGKKDFTLRSKLFSLAKKNGLKSSGGYTQGQMRAANYLDFVCESDEGEIAVDMHKLFYQHGAQAIERVWDKGLYQVLQNEMRASIEIMCSEKYECQNMTYYARGNKHPRHEEFCVSCVEKLIAVDNKKLIYTVIMLKR